MEQTNFEWCVYTLRHRKVIAYLIEKLIHDPQIKQELQERTRYHDLDKVLMYHFLEQVESQMYHVMHQPHHLECPGEKTYLDYLETVIDFESAPYTKPDKPLNAYDFTKKLRELRYIDEKTEEILIAIMHDLGIDHSYDVTKDSEAMAFVKGMEEITETDVGLAMLDYARTNPPEIDYIKQRLGKE